MDKNNKNAHLPMLAMKEVPIPNSNAEDIIALIKKSGRVKGYKLSGGRVISKEEGVVLAKQGGIKGVGIAERNGYEYLKSIPDGKENNNLGNLPSISE